MAEGLKSAWEIALEKTRQLDKGEEATKPLSDERKKRIAEIKQEFKAKLAEQEIMLENTIKRLLEQHNPQEVADQINTLKDRYGKERMALEQECERAIQTVRET